MVCVECVSISSRLHMRSLESPYGIVMPPGDRNPDVVLICTHFSVHWICTIIVFD
jgi:hypothetical protein